MEPVNLNAIVSRQAILIRRLSLNLLVSCELIGSLQQQIIDLSKRVEQLETKNN